MSSGSRPQAIPSSAKAPRASPAALTLVAGRRAPRSGTRSIPEGHRSMLHLDVCFTMYASCTMHHHAPGQTPLGRIPDRSTRFTSRRWAGSDVHRASCISHLTSRFVNQDARITMYASHGSPRSDHPLFSALRLARTCAMPISSRIMHHASRITFPASPATHHRSWERRLSPRGPGRCGSRSLPRQEEDALHDGIPWRQPAPRITHHDPFIRMRAS